MILHPFPYSLSILSMRKRHFHMLLLFFALFLSSFFMFSLKAQVVNFGQSNLDFNGNGGVSQGTSLMFGPDGRLYVVGLKGVVDIFTIQRNGVNNYIVTNSEELSDVATHPNHNDDGTSSTTNQREATGLTVAGTAANPVIYVTSSDPRIGGPSGDKDLDTNSGVITRFIWNGSSWDAVDIVRGLPRSEENHATNGLEFVTVNGTDYLIVCSGGHANAGSPSDNFAWTTEYALSGAVLSVNLTQLEALPILTDPTSGRDYIYDIPTLDDPTRPNVNGITDPDDPAYDGIDQGDPWGGNDGLNQAMIVPGGPVQIFSPGYRNTYDLVVTQDGKVFITDNGANGGWGGFPENEGLVDANGNSLATNNYDPSEPGSSGSVGGESVNNQDHLTMATIDINNYPFGQYQTSLTNNNPNNSGGHFYGGHPVPIRANPAGAGLFTNPESNSYNSATSVFRTQTYDPDGSTPGSTTDPNVALPANWPPVPLSLANPVEGDWRGPGINNPDGQNDVLVTTWGTNTNGIDEYTASNFGGAMQGDLIAGKNGGVLRRVELNPDGSLDNLTQTFISNLGGNALGVTCNSDTDPFPGTIWVAPFDGNIIVLEPQDFVICILPGEAGYDPNGDNDSDGYTNQDEIDNKTSTQTDEDVICNGGAEPNDFDKAAGGTLVSDLNDLDDDNDGIADAIDPMQLGDPTNSGSDAFTLPVTNELESDNPILKGYLGLGFTGLMNNGDPNPNWLNWLDRKDDPSDPNPNDLLGGAIGAMTMQMTSGTALGASNDQEKGFQYGINVDQNTGGFTVEGELLSFDDPLQLYGSSAPANGEMGLFIGDGTQKNYIKVVLTQNGVEALQEINDATHSTLSATIPVANRPDGSAKFRFNVDPSNGDVTIEYSLELNPWVSLGTLSAQGSILTAIQQSATPLMVGLIGSSNTQGVELEGTWNYLNVTGDQPSITQQIPDQEAFFGDPDIVLDLDNFFDDNDGQAGLTYSIFNNTNLNIPVAINGSNLTITIPGTAETSTVTVRATDGNALFVDQTFNVTVTDEPSVLFRVNAGGGLVAATDGPNPDWVANTGNGPQSGTGFTVNTGTTSSFTPTTLNASVPTYTPIGLFDTERWDPDPVPEMQWEFGTGNGNFIVNLFFKNGFGGTSAPGARVFDVEIEGVLVLNDWDLSAEYGHQVGAMESFPITVTDGTLNIEFLHGTENPLINAIEILGSGGAVVPPITVTQLADQTNSEGQTINLPVSASGGDPLENFSFSATGLPPGLQIEPTTGLLFDDIDVGAAGSYNVTITVDKPSSTPVQMSFIWNVVTNPPSAGNVLYRVNAGGPLVPASDAPNPDWGEDSGTFGNVGNSQYLSASSGSGVYSITSASAYPGPVDVSDPSIPAGTPPSIFDTERYDAPAAPEMLYEFPVTPGNDYEVRIYLAEIFSGIIAAGERVFDVSIEGTVPSSMDDIDPFALKGAAAGFVVSHTLTAADNTLQVEFIHGVENPAIKGIEILETSITPTADVTVSATLQGRSDHSGDYTMKLYPVGSTTETASYTLTADALGNMTASGITPGTYQVALKFPNSLQKIQTMTLNAGANTMSFGELPMGDANDDNGVTILDFSSLANTFNLPQSDPAYNGLADFNGDGGVTILDFSLLVTNYNTGGDTPTQ